MHDTLLRLTQATAAASTFADSYFHGEDHWRGVADQALWIGEQMGWGRRERLFLFAFGAIHDCRRENDDRDPQHGERAADWLVQEGWGDTIGLGRSAQDRLHFALVHHDRGRTSEDALIGACWDADRSLLGRVGISPDPRFFSTAHDATWDALVIRGQEVADAPATWADLITRALR